MSRYLIVALLGLLMAACGRGEPVYNAQDIAIIGSDGPLTMEQVHDAILAGLRENKWNVVKDEPGEVIADISFRRHRAEIGVDYAINRYSINYRDSENLLYDGEEIHKKYNQYIRNLQNSIDRQLKRN